MIGRNFPSYKKELWQQITLPEPFFIQIQKMSSIFLEELHLFIAFFVCILIYRKLPYG